MKKENAIKFLLLNLLTVLVVGCNQGGGTSSTLSITSNTEAVKAVNAVWTSVGQQLPSLRMQQSNIVSLAFTNINFARPYLAYVGSNGKAQVNSFNGSSWQSVSSNPDVSDGAASFLSLVFNAVDNKPYLAYSNGSNGGPFVLKMFNGSSWVNITNPTHTGSYDVGTQLAFNPANNQPYIVYSNVDNSYKAGVQFFNGYWSLVGGWEFTPPNAQYPRLAFNPANNQPYIAYPDCSAHAPDGCKMELMAFNGSSWGYIGGKDFSSSVTSSDISFVFNPVINQPTVMFWKSGKLTIIRYNGSSWATLVSPSIGNANTAVMAINPADSSLYIATNNDLFKYNGNTWDKVGSGTIAPDIYNSNISLTFNKISGQPYVAYTAYPGNVIVKTLPY